jgi:hypothetical protein
MMLLPENAPETDVISHGSDVQTTSVETFSKTILK